MRNLPAILISVALLAAPAAASEAVPEPEPPTEPEQPMVEVAFVLDTTGSMSGLIAGAKAKIWFIANQIVTAEPKPHVRIALVPYRDKGDEYVTKVFDLTDNIDQVYTDLMGFSAAGGGDTPENVNQALHDAVNKLSWSEDESTLRIIYLVGDCPPHNEYEDVPTYDKIAYQAINEKDIYINTILCGNHGEAMKIWQEIARRAEGSFAQIDQSGGVETIATPFDDKLGELNAALAETNVYYGDSEARARQADMDERLKHMERPAAADRAGFVAEAGEGRASAALGTPSDAPGGLRDLVDAMREETLDVRGLDEELLPEEMREMTPAEREAYIAENQARRDEILTQIRELSEKRADFQRKAMEERAEGEDGFDATVVRQLREQATRKGLTYEDADTPGDEPTE